MNYMEKRKKEINKSIIISILCVSMCIIASPLIIIYILSPKDEITKFTKEYYITSSILYFNEHEDKNTISVDYLIKSGYAEYLSDLKNSNCSKKDSYITKDGNLYNIVLACNKYNSKLAIYMNKDGK